MITITIDSRSVEISGHAYYAEKGKDIVCAACSMLFYTLLHSFDKIGCRYSFSDGSTGCSVRFFSFDQRAIDFFECVVNGFELLAEKQPEHVTLIKK